MFEFRDPSFLIFLIYIPFLVYRYFKRQYGTVRFSSISNLKQIERSWALWGRHSLLLLRCITVLLLVLALARPQKGREETMVNAEGIDIILTVDVSGSMKAEDFRMDGKPRNRLYVVKEVVRDFIEGRQNDRIGIVTFARRPYTLCPLTLDYGWLIQQLDRAQIGIVRGGTAIGSAIATSVNRLRESTGKSKVVILLTDGRNNTGRVDPITAADAASALKVKIYTIGAGTKGLAPVPVRDFLGNRTFERRQMDIDEASLKEIARKTGGRYFRATDTESLRQIYKEIDEMETVKVEMEEYREYKDFYSYLLILAIITLMFEKILANTRFRRLP